jgi:GNAT superfamily N-acetyltransferase
LAGFVAVVDGEHLGLATYRLECGGCEIVTLNSLREGIGIGTLLVEAVRSVALSNKCRRVWVITTNDNLQGLRFYQRRGFSLVAIHRNAIELSRKLKPEIPLIGLNGIPLRDELELEMVL